MFGRLRSNEISTDPMTQGIDGEAWTLAPLEFPDDPDGEKLRRAAQIIQGLSSEQWTAILGEPEDWPPVPAHVNANHYL